MRLAKECFWVSDGVFNLILMKLVRCGLFDVCDFDQMGAGWIITRWENEQTRH